MTITALDGPLIARRSNPLGSIGTGSANQNPEAGPSALEFGYGLLDPRIPYTYYPGQGAGAVYNLYCKQPIACIDQVPSALADNNIAASQSPGSSALTLVSSTAAGITVSVSITRADTGATVTGLLAIDTAMTPLQFGQSASASNQQINPSVWDPTKAVARNVRITSGGDDSLVTFTVVGYDLYGYPMSEAITGANAGVASGVKAFKYIASITPSSAAASTVKVGTGDKIGLPIRADRIPYVEAWWGSPQASIIGSGGSVIAGTQEVEISVPALSTVVNSQVWEVPIPFGFTVSRVAFIQTVATTTGSKAATFTAGINGTAMTGGVISVTSNAATGIVFPGTNISALNTSPSPRSAVTITIATPGVVTWPAHGLVAGTPVVFSTTGALPTGLTAGTTYYVISAGLGTNSFEVSTSAGGSAVNTSGTQSGTHTATALNMLTFTASSVTAFVEGGGILVATLINNELTGGTFTAADTTTATTTTGDTRGTLALPDNSDGVKRLTMFVSPYVVNLQSQLINGLFGVAQNTANNNGT